MAEVDDSGGGKDVCTRRSLTPVALRASLASVSPGPTSRRTLLVSLARTLRPSANLTGSLSCRHQYFGLVASAAEIQVPVCVEIHGSCGACSRTLLTISLNASTAGSIMREWNAWD